MREHSRRLDDYGVLGCQASEAMPVGAQRVGKDVRIAPVVLGTSDGEVVAEAVELLRVDRVDLETAFEQRLDNRAMRHGQTRARR
jgi:hypothetical protein